MKPYLLCLSLVVVAHGVHAQGQPGECELQELAIAAALGNHDAQYDLGVEYFRGKLVAKDYSKAAYLWKQACAGRIPNAYNNLGYLTYHGKGVNPDPVEAVRLWRIAADLGQGESLFHLGEAHLDGIAVPKDYVLAYAYAKAAESFASGPTREAVLKLAQSTSARAARHLGPTDRAKAESEAVRIVERVKVRMGAVKPDA